MTALSADRFRQPGPRAIKHDLRPLAAGVAAWKSGLCMLITQGTSKGYYAPASSAKIGVVVGVFDEDVDNTAGADGALTVNVEFAEEIWVETLINDATTPVAVTDRGTMCYALDDQTATMQANGLPAGIVYDLDSSGNVQVQLNYAPANVPTNMQSGTGTLAAGTLTVTGVKLTANSRILLTMKDPGAGAITAFAALDAPVASRNTATGQFVVNAIDNTKATIASAVCTFDYLIIG